VENFRIADCFESSINFKAEKRGIAVFLQSKNSVRRMGIFLDCIPEIFFDMAFFGFLTDVFRNEAE